MMDIDYPHIIIGGGSYGCFAALRLAELHGGRTVVIIEQDPDIMLRAAPDERTREVMRRSLPSGDQLAANITAESVAASVTPWRMIFGYGGMTFRRGQTRTWSNAQPLLGGEATVTYDDSTSIVAACFARSAAS